MAIRIGIHPYRLLFKRPFGTSHGMRDGTDSLFIQLKEDAHAGFGEVTLPPYLKETVPGSVHRLKGLATKGPWTAEELTKALDEEVGSGAQGLRAALHMALIDLQGKKTDRTAREILDVVAHQAPVTLMTIGICETAEVEERLAELPQSGALKIKVGDPKASERIMRVIDLDNRQLFLDGNQGFDSVQSVLQLASTIGVEKLLGIEQPFSSEQDAVNSELGAASKTVVYADESIQTDEDLQRAGKYFGGVNLKLVKCGGLDRALAMIRSARKAGKAVMLGSMSESSLGCTAMAQISGLAEIVDLDGPWLIKNDPFQGVDMARGKLVLPKGSGLGVELVGDLQFDSIGA